MKKFLIILIVFLVTSCATLIGWFQDDSDALLAPELDTCKVGDDCHDYEDNEVGNCWYDGVTKITECELKE